MKRKPNSVTLWHAVGIVDPEGNAYTIRNLEKTASYVVNCQESTCTCKAYVKFRYCKHLLFVLKKSNKSSATIDLLSVCTFINRGNTRRAHAQAYNNDAWINMPWVGHMPNASMK
jgi:hypothetical protein